MKFADKYNHLETESKWIQKWEKDQVYKWDDTKSRDETFVVDAPPPTVSGSLHVGHVFSYTQTDLVTRYQRMTGKNIFYRMGWDDNGLPTERRVQNYFGIKCDPKVDYKNDWKPERNLDDKKIPEEVSRRNFVEACEILTAIDERIFEDMFRKIGLSVDWGLTYSTVGSHCTKVSQLSFLDLAKKGFVYSSEAPTMWDTDFRSAIAQAELEDRERPGAYHDINFMVDGGEEFTISTTRPELLAACIAVVAHPEDARYKELFGKFAITPLFQARVPILSSEHADPEKGSGILMICTFGDVNDVSWWKQNKLPARQIIQRDGRLGEVQFGQAPFESKNSELAQKNYDLLKGLYINQARKKVVELLREPNSSVDQKSAALVGEPKAILHPVKFYEKGDKPIEFLTTRQWFIKVLEHKDALLAQGNKIVWTPDHMRSRYENWVLGLNQDWCISRQRYFGVPFPVWYPLNAQGEIVYDKPIFATLEQLPVDPSVDAPTGYDSNLRDKPSGFTADPDVMDTWATSALTPQIASHWGLDNHRHDSLFPMDIRPQSHEIIRTWAFSTIAKAWMHEEKIPWKNVLISGWILDPDRKKMSKSKGNVVVPDELITKYSADAIRYWASRARLGVDTAYDESLFKNGAKLTNKLFNASKFLAGQFERLNISLVDTQPKDITEILDLSFISKLSNAIKLSAEAFDKFDYATALNLSEDCFWDFCDNYLEIVKVRSYQDLDNAGRKSALATLAFSMKTFLKLFAPFLPFITEEIWEAYDHKTSIHREKFASVADLPFDPYKIDSNFYDHASKLMSLIRGAKTSKQKSLKWEIAKLEILADEKAISSINPVLNDVISAGNVKDYLLTVSESDLQIAVDFNENWTA